MSPQLEYLLRGKAFLAPMLATTDIPFRTICKEFGAALTFTEMVSAKGIIDDSSISFKYAVFDPAEKPVAIQLLASNAGYIESAIQKLLPLQPALFDLNAGCPSNRVCEAGAGAELLEDIGRFREVLCTATRASSTPISVKLRASDSDSNHSVETLAEIVEECGAGFITVHARARHEKYDVPADWRIIARAKRAVSIPVVGNGDIFSSEDAYRMFDETGCDSVMIARGALGAPWIFDDIKRGISRTATEGLPPVSTLLPVIMRHLEMLLQDFGDVYAVPRMRKHLLWYARWYKGIDKFRQLVFQNDTPMHLIETAKGHFSQAVPLDPNGREFAEMQKRFRRRVLHWTLMPKLANSSETNS
ncbi:MAG: tRNA dihydrouridine synthase DusB [Ectothiorhodospiraceae bacterium]|nr:tRNA dihydrouridine synthase DusB [Ectothiorhodospiraceae bacterium]